MKREIEPSAWSRTKTPLIGLPILVVALNVMVWFTAVSRSGFWADDFLNVTRYFQSLGDLANDRANQGKYVANVFWALGTQAFGFSSVVPFLVLNTLVFAIGVVVWLQVGTRTRWGALEAWWIGGLFIATAAWLPTTLWSSNIVHSAGFLALGAAMLAHDRCMRAQTLRSSMYWSLACGAAWTLAVVSNLLYIGLLVIAVYCAAHQVLKMRQFGVATARLVGAVGFWSLLVPALYFATVAYPSTTANSAYATNGLQFISQNLKFYRAALAPTSLLLAVYIVVLLAGLAGGVFSALRRKDWFPLAILAAAGSTALPALVQGQQRDIHYMAMPLLFVFSAFASGVRPVMLHDYKHLVRIRYALFVAAIVTLFLVFRQGAVFRSYFVQTPYGAAYGLEKFRSEVASLTPENATICAKLDLDSGHQALFIAAMSGEDGFAVPPISAGRTYLIPVGQACPTGTEITVSLGSRGNFEAHG